MAYANPNITAASIEATEFMELTRRLPRHRRAEDDRQRHGRDSRRASRGHVRARGAADPGRGAARVECASSARGGLTMRCGGPCAAALVCFLASRRSRLTCARPAGQRVYISVDLEGISGVNGDDQTSAGQPEYGRARKLMAEDANAAIRGAFEGGATEVVVNDSHGGQRNLLARGSRSACAPDHPQLQASRHDGRPRRFVRRRHLRRVSRQSRHAARALRPHRVGHRQGSADQRAGRSAKAA